ncbi:MAG: hypothetical protein IJX46_06575 [Clostridia bacterium]|nr:hypothetical protein [Clostridia bacterium]
MAYNDFVALVREKTKKNTAAEKSAAVSAVGNPVVDRMIDYMKYQRIGYDTLGDDINSLLEGTKGYLEGGWADGNATAAQKQSVGNMISRLKSAKQYYTDHADQFEGDVSKSIAEIDRALGSLTELSGYVDQAGEVYSKFENANEYNTAKQYSEIDEYFKDFSSQDMSEVMLAIFSNAQAGNRGFVEGITQSGKKFSFPMAQAEAYGSYLNSARGEREVGEYVTWAKQQGDFDSKSYAGGALKHDTKDNGTVDISARVNGTADYSTSADRGQAYIGYYDGLVNAYVNTDDAKFYPMMTEDEIKTFNYIRNTQGDEAAKKYHDAIYPVLGQRYKEQLFTDKTAFAKEHPWLATAQSVIEEALFSPTTYIFNKFDEFRGKGYNPDSAANIMGSANDLVFATVPEVWAKKYGWDEGEKGFYTFMYNTGVSVAQNVVTSAIYGGYWGGSVGAWASLAAMGTQAANSTMRNLAAQGAEDWQIYLLGTVAGATEAIMEKVPLDKLLKIGKEGGKAGLKATLKNILGQAWTEMKEEMATEIVNILADSIIRLDESELAKAVGEKGLFNALKDSIGQVIMAGASGAVSGGFMGLAFSIYGGTIGSAQYRPVGKFMVDNGAANTLIEQGLKLGQGSEAYEIADLLRRRMANNKEGKLNAMSYADVGRLYALETAAVRDQYMQATEKKLSVQLEAAGVKSSKVEGLAAALAKAISGEQMTRAETKAIGKSAQAMQILEQSKAMLDPARVAFNPIQKSTAYAIADGAMVITRLGNSNMYRVDLLPSANAERVASTGEIGDGAVRTLDSQSVRQVELMVKKAAEGAGIADISSRFGEQLSSKAAVAETLLSAELSGVNENVAGIAAGIASAMGGDLRIVFDPELSATGDTGLFRRNYDGTREAYVAPTLGGAVSTLIHELFHDIEDTAAGKAFIAAAVEYAKTQPARNPENGANRYEEVKHLYQTRKGVNDKAELETEVGAKIAGDILASEDALRAVLEHMKPQQKASLWQRLKRALTSLRNKLKGQKNAKPAETQLNVLERLYKQAFAQRVIQDAVENPRVGDPGAVSESDGKGVTRTNEEKTQVSSEKEKAPEREKADVGNYDFTKPFYQQIEDYKSGKFPQGDSLVLGATPDVLKEIGFNSLPVTINQKHIDYVLNGTKNTDHQIGEILLKYLPTALKNPVAVITSKTQSATSVVAILSITHDGNQITVPVYIDGLGKQNGIRIDSNAITSVYARKNAISSLLVDAITTESNGSIGVFYWDKKRALALLSGGKVTMPNVPNTLSDGYVHSIRENGSPVKPKFENVTESQQFKRWFGDWQNHPDKASKIVNPDGTPKVFYHGSTAYFTVFDIKKAKRSGLYGKGFYFTDSDTHAGQYGKLYAVYLNIRDPLTAGGKTVTRAQVRKYLEAVAENEDYSIENYGTYDVDKVLDIIMEGETQKDAFAVLNDINGTAIGDLVEATKLFNTVNGTTFDGIVVPTETVAFEATQIKSATDNIGTFDKNNPDIRYEIAEDEIPNSSREYAQMKREEEKRAASEKRKPTATYKAYNTSHMIEVLRGASSLITAEALYESGGESFANIKTTGVSLQALARKLSEAYNLAQEKGATDEEIRMISDAAAEDIISNTYADDVDFLEKLTEEQQIASTALYILRRGIRRMQIGEVEIGDIRHYYGKKKARGVISRWRVNKSSKGTVSAADIANELAEAGVPLAVENDSWAEADIIIALNELYEKSKATFEETVRTQIGTADEYAELKQKISDQVFEAFREGEADVRVAKAQAAAKVIVDVTRAKELARRKRETGRLSGKEWKDLVESIGKIATTYNVSVPAVRAFAKAYVGFVSTQAPELHAVLTDSEGSESVYKRYADAKNDGENQILDAVDPRIARGIYAIAEGDESTALTADELEALHAGLRNLLALDNRYNRVHMDGRWQNTDKYAKQGIADSESEYGSDGEKQIGAGWIKQVEDPYDVASSVGGHNRDSVLARAVRAIQHAATEAQYKEMQYMKEVEDFFDSHKAFRKKYRDQRIEFKTVRKNPVTGQQVEGSVTMTLGEFLGLYMTSKRKQAFISLAMSDIVFDKMPGVRDHEQRLAGLKMQYEGLTEVQIEAAMRGMGNALIAEIGAQYEKIADDDIRAFVAAVERFFNETSTSEKTETDLLLYGYTNVLGGYYYPLERDKNAFDVNLIGNDRIIGNMIGVGNFSFNKATVERASKPLMIRDTMTVMRRHAHQLATYTTLTVPLQNINRIYNCKVNDTTLKDFIHNNVWSGFGKYLRNYLLDVQGSRRADADFEELRNILSTVKSNYAKSVLAMNPKSILTQFSTVIAMQGQVSYASWAKGLAMVAFLQRTEGEDGKILARLAEMDKYSHGAAVRNDSNEIYLATGAVGKLGNVTDKLMIGQLLTDRLTCLAMYAMCQYEVQRTQGLAVGTAENKAAAGKMLDDMILNLQDTSAAATKTALARSTNEFISNFAMFKSAELKQFSRIAYALADMRAHGVTRARVGAFSKELGAFLGSKVYAAVIALVWAAFRGKWEEDDEGKDKGYIEMLTSELFMDMVGFVPVFGSLAENVMTGFGLELPSESVVNDLITAIRSTGGIISDIADGGGFEYKKAVNILSSVGQALGLPVRNLANIVDGAFNMAGLADSRIKYNYDKFMSGGSATVDELREAIDAGDERLAETVADMLMVDRVGSSVGSEAAGEIVSLYASGETGVLPSKIGNKITVSINDESREIELTAAEQRELRAEYGKATSAVRRMVSTSAYSRLTTSERAVAVRDMNRLYMDRAKAKLYGADMTTAVAMTYLMSEGKYICAYAHIKAIKADKSIKNKATQIKRWLRSQGLSVAEQRAILYASGYRSEENLAAVKRLLRSASLSAKEKAAVRAALSIE